MRSPQKKRRVVCFGEVMLRLSPPGNEVMLQSPRLDARFGGAEANVAVSLARLGHDSAMATVLPDNALGRAAADELRRYGVDISAIVFAPGRLGLYFVMLGAVLKATDVLYDRAHSAFADAPDGADWGKVLAEAEWFHMSGVTPALGPAAAKAAERAVREAKHLGLKVSFDGNFRAKLWAVWKGDAQKILHDILAKADLAFVNERDIGLVLGKSFANTEEAAHAAFAEFPDLSKIACTGRKQHGVGEQELSAALFTRDQVIRIAPIALSGIVDRIGSGDAFAAGLLHGLLSNMNDRAALEFALAAAAHKHAIPGDFNLATESEIRDLLENRGLDVRR